jgi:shikimate dehydrogenase
VSCGKTHRAMITGTTSLIAHIGWPTHAFRAPQVYNPYFEHAGIDAVVVPMGCRAEPYPAFLRALFTLENVRGALITMPHKVTTVALLDEASAAVRVAGACNAVRRDANGRLVGDMFDGEGFVRSLAKKGCSFIGARAFVVGAGGVGSAIAASLAGAGLGAITLFDVRAIVAHALADRLRANHPALEVRVGNGDPAGHDIVVNATPLGLRENDRLPMDASRIAPEAFVGDVVMPAQPMTPLLRAAEARGCRLQVGADMLFEQIPAYLEFFGLPTAGAEALRALARLDG